MKSDITEAPYDRRSINALEKIFGLTCVTEKNETINKSAILKNALKGASKTGDGYGIPDSVVYMDNEFKNPFIFVEVKAPGLIEKAKQDLLHYHTKVQKSSVYTPFSLAISGNETVLKRFNSANLSLDDIFVCDHSTKEKSKIHISSIDELSKYKEILKSLYLNNTDTYEVNIPGFTQDEIISFCVEINKEFHGLGIAESSRATILTYFLVSCLDKNFIEKTSKITSFDDLHLFSKKSFKDIISKKKFTLNKNSFAILYDDIDLEHLSSSERQNYLKYVDGFKKIFEIIDNRIASDVKGRNITRGIFIERLIASGNFLGDAYEVFHTYTSGNDMGQYFTPRHAVDILVTLIEFIRGEAISKKDIIYDPACGVGGFLCLALKHATNGKLPNEKSEILEELGQRIFGSEIEPAISDMARVNLLLRGDGKSGIVTGSSLDSDAKPGQQTAIKELFGENIKPTIVLMNPPFPSDKSTFKSYDFIEHALDVSSEGAYIGAIIPVSVINGKTHFKEFRKRTLKIAELKAVITLPVDLFEPKATVDSAIVVLKKTKTGHQDSNIYFASCDNDGLKMHKGKKQRMPDFNTIDDFKLLKNFWLQDRYQEVFEKFKYANPLQIDKSYFEEGGEWSPYQWLSDNPLSIEPRELFRLSRFIRAEYNHGKELKNLGSKW